MRSPERLFDLVSPVLISACVCHVHSLKHFICTWNPEDSSRSFLKGTCNIFLVFFFSLLVLFTSLNAVVLGVKGENKSAAHLNYWKLLIIIILVLSKAFCAESSSQLHLEHLGLLGRCFQLMWFFFFFCGKKTIQLKPSSPSASWRPGAICWI